MPFESALLSDIEQTVARPAIFSILNQLSDITNLSKDTMIYYAGKRSVMHSPGTTIDDASRDAVFASSRYAFVEVEEDYDLPSMQEIAAHTYDNLPVFNDPKLEFSIHPVYVTSNVVISVRYRSTSETEVRRWMADCLIKASRGRDINLHDIQYTFTLPDAFLMILGDIYTLRENQSGYGDSIEQYLEKHGTSRITLQTNRAGEHPILAISETQTGIQGLFDFVGVPDKPTFDATTATWEVAFNYKFNYQRPEAVALHYPLSVHNQLLPAKYLDYERGTIDLYLKEVFRSYGYQAFEHFSLSRIAEETRRPKPYLRMPEFDDFQLSTVTYGTATVFTALCLLGENNEPLLNLGELGNYQIRPEILNYMKSDYVNLTKEHHSYLRVELYINHVLQPDGCIRVTPDLDVLAVAPLNPRNVHHIRFSAVIDPGTVTTEATLKLSESKDAFISLLSSINELLRLNPDFQALRNNQEIEDWELQAVYRILTGGMRSNNYTPTPKSYSVNAMPQYTNPMQGSQYGSNGFLSQIDPKVAQQYFQTKRLIPMTSMTSAIMVHPK